MLCAGAQEDDMATLLDLAKYINCTGAAADSGHAPLDNW